MPSPLADFALPLPFQQQALAAVIAADVGGSCRCNLNVWPGLVVASHVLVSWIVVSRATLHPVLGVDRSCSSPGCPDLRAYILAPLSCPAVLVIPPGDAVCGAWVSVVIRHCVFEVHWQCFCI